mgnify:CR=1 FL=1
MNLQESHVQLKRSLGLLALTAFGVGDILGIGVYGLIGRVAGVVGNAAWLSYVLAGITAGLTGLTYAELASRFPQAGGAAHFCRTAYRTPLVTFLVIFFVALSGLFSMATGSRVIAQYALAPFVNVPPILSEYALPISFVLLLAAIAARGIALSSAANAICTAIELAGLLIIVLLGIRFIGTANYLDWHAGDTAAPETWGGIAVMTGAAITFYAFIGFEDLVNLSEEAHRPERNIPLSICLAIAITTILYCVIALIAVSVLTPAELAPGKTPLLDVVRRAAPGFPVWVYSVIPAFAAFNTALLNLIMASRLLYGMARGDGRILPAALGYVHPRWRTPLAGVGLSATVVIALLVLFLDVKTLAAGASTFLLVVFLLLHVALLRIKRDPAFPRPLFHIPKAIPAAGALTCLGVLAAQDLQALRAGGWLLLAALVLYGIQRVCYGKPNVEPSE